MKLKQIALAVQAALNTNKLHGRSIVLKIRYADFDTITRRKTRIDHFSQAEDIFRHAWELWLDNGTIERHVRLLGITVTQLDPIHYENIQLPLWDTTHL